MVALDGRIVVLSLRIAQALLAILILALTAYIAHWWTGWWHHDSPSQINFILFTSIWTLLSLAYLTLVPWRFPDSLAHHKYAILAAEALTMLFWFAGFLAAAVFTSGRLCYGSVCSALKAAVVFAAFEWLCFAGTCAMAVMHVIRTRKPPAQNDKHISTHTGV